MTTTPTGTRAALDAALIEWGTAVARGSGSAEARTALARAITAHVEAEVARRLAAAPDVEAAIRSLNNEATGAGRIYATGSNSACIAASEVARHHMDALRAAIAADKARAVAGATDGAVRAERFADTVCSLVGARDHGRGGQTVDAGTARLYADAVVRIGAIIARDKARPTPDEARRLVDEYDRATRNSYVTGGPEALRAARTALISALTGKDQT